MKKKLVFHLYCGEGWEHNEAIKIHFACLKHYQNVFDEMLIVLAIDGETNGEVASSVRKKIVEEITHPFLTIKMVKNTAYREAKTFYDEVIDQDYDGIVFFGHSKGYTNFNNKENKKKNIIEWIIGCYWLSLEFLDEAEIMLAHGTKYYNGNFYGSFKIAKGGRPSKDSAYMGTFFWTNVTELKKILKDRGKELFKLSTRMSAEEFPGNICYIINNCAVASHKWFAWFPHRLDGYGTFNGLSPSEGIEVAFPDEYQSFCDFEKNILTTAEVSKE